MLSLIKECDTCKGEGRVDRELYPSGGQVIAPDTCPDCHGDGFIETIVTALPRSLASGISLFQKAEQMYLNSTSRKEAA